MAKTSLGVGFVDFLQPTFTTYDMAMPSELMGTEYLLQITEMQPLWALLWADLFCVGETTHPPDHSVFIALQAMQIRWGWGPDFTCMEHGTPHARTVNSSSGGYGKWVRGEDGQELVDKAPCNRREFTTTVLSRRMAELQSARDTTVSLWT